MKKIKYKDQNNKNYYLRIIVLLVLIFIFFLLNRWLAIYSEKINNISLDSLTTLKEVIEYYGSTYISEKDSKTEGYKIDVELVFKVLPYNADGSKNEDYYNDLIEHCAKVIFYKSFRMIDEKNNLTVEVICKSNKIEKILINGIEDYFIYMDSLKEMENYQEIEEIDISVESPILQQCIDNNWKNEDINFGTRESIFDKYYLYYDEGIRVRTIDEKIFNIIFSKNYKEEVAGGIFPGMDMETIEGKLGKPAFRDDEIGVIGYKGKKFYVFFYEDEISIYKNKVEETSDFLKLADRFLAEDINFLEFMNELTYIWPDYSEYKYDSNYVYISYPLKGIEIRVNYDDINGILVYNNIKVGLPTISKYLENTYFVARLQLDLVFNSEKRRITDQKDLKDNCLEFKESLSEEDLKIIGESLKYDIYPLLDKDGYIFSMRFISKDESMPNRELNDGMDTYIWYNDYFIYSKKYRGIYALDTNTGHVSTVIMNSRDTFKIKGIEDNILKYDKQELTLQF